MAENSEVIKLSPQRRKSSSELERAERRRSGPKGRKARIPPRRPTQRHCPNRKSISKRKKRRLHSTSEPPIQDPESPKISDSSSLSQTSTSSSLSPVSPVPSSSTGKKRRYVVDKCDGRGETALHKASIKGDVQRVKFLLRHGANPNHQDYAGWTPLHEACIRGRYNVAHELLKAGANVNTPGLHNVTALHDATAWSHLSLVKLLLKYGAELTCKTDKGDTPVEVASPVVLNYLESHGLIPESARARVVPERTYEMRKSTYRSKVVKANSADVTFKIKVRCEQKGEDRGVITHNKKSKKSARLNHSNNHRQHDVQHYKAVMYPLAVKKGTKKNMESEETKKEVASPSATESKETSELKSSSSSSTSMTTLETVEATSSTGAATSSGAAENVSEAESRRSSASLDDEDEGKRNKRRKDKEEHTRKEDTRAKDDHKKDEHASKKDEHAHKKEDHLVSRGKSSSTNSASPKSTTSLDGQEGEDGMKSIGSPGPKVPPLKIVIPPAETEQGSRNGKNMARHHPYVVVSNDETSTASSTVTTSPSSPAVLPPVIKEEPPSPLSSTLTGNDEQRIQQRVLRSTHSSNRNMTGNNSSSNGTTSGSNSSATSGSSSPAAPDLSPQTDTVAQSKDEPKPVKTESSVGNLKGSKSVDGSSKVKAETSVKVEPNDEEASAKMSTSEPRSSTSYHKEETNTVELHPRKRKLKSKQEPPHMEVDHVPSFSSTPHPHEVPVTNCYQMFMDIRKQIDVKRKGLFPIQPKPPQGFKDYLMNRCTYTLAGNAMPRLKRRNADPPEGIPEPMRELYLEQENDRYRLRMEHIVEKEKLVLSVEQEILRVHGRAARALANQALPFSACTILKDEEVYNVITPEQEEKDRNARSRYNGRLFISWLQDVDDKWEKIKEEMLSRHHKEAESLHAVQKFKWDLKMRLLGLWKSRSYVPIDENFVPMISVSDDFDLLPE